MAVGDTLEIMVAVALQVAVVERIIQESMYGLSAETTKEAVVERKRYWRFYCICMFVFFFFCLQKEDQDMDHFGSRIKTRLCYKKGGRSINVKYCKRLAN